MNEQKGVFKNLYKNLIKPVLKKDTGIDAEYLTNLYLSILSLSSSELNNLIGEEHYLNIKKHTVFEWRNWRLIPKDEKYWIIENKGS